MYFIATERVDHSTRYKKKLLVLGRLYPYFMYLLYIDESGAPKSWKIQKHFVLGGVAIHEGQVGTLTRKLNELQKQYFPKLSFPIEFHATDIREGIDRWRSFQPEEREEILRKVYEVIDNAGFPNLIVFAASICEDSVTSPEQALRDTFEEICSKFNNFLIWEYRLNIKTKGLLIIDETRVGEYRHLLDTFQQSTKYGYLGNIIDIPYFAKCGETRMLQLADFVSNAVFRYYEKREDKYLKMILPRVSRRPGKYELDGLRHITKEKSCKCFACCPV